MSYSVTVGYYIRRFRANTMFWPELHLFAVYMPHLIIMMLLSYQCVFLCAGLL